MHTAQQHLGERFGFKRSSTLPFKFHVLGSPDIITVAHSPSHQLREAILKDQTISSDRKEEKHYSEAEYYIRMCC